MLTGTLCVKLQRTDAGARVAHAGHAAEQPAGGQLESTKGASPPSRASCARGGATCPPCVLAS
eukprot:14866246-Alexandrium_andersonii.AAC.1